MPKKHGTKSGKNRKPKKIAIIEQGDPLAAHANTCNAPIFKSQAVDDAIPEEWEDRAKKAWEYYILEPLVSNVIETWVAFAIGDVITVTSENESLQESVQAEMKRLNIKQLLYDFIVQTIVKGDGLLYRYPKNESGEIERVESLNTTFIEVKYKNGEIDTVQQSADLDDPLSDQEEQELTAENALHVKWKAPAYAKHGNSMILPAFEDIELLRDFRKAQRAIVRRWITPLRLIKIGFHDKATGKFYGVDKKTVNQITAVLNKMTGRTGAVVPFYVDVVTEGIDKAIPDMNKDIVLVKEDILVGMGMSRSVITGDGPNFATANVSFKKIIGVLSAVQSIGKTALNWLFDPKDEITFGLPQMDANSSLDIKKFMVDLYERGIISKEAVQAAMEVNPETQEKKIADQVIPITSMKDLLEAVKMGVISAETARKKLGVDVTQEATAIANEEEKDVLGLYARALKNANSSILDYNDRPIAICTVAEFKRHKDNLFNPGMMAVADCFSDCKVLKQMVGKYWTEKTIEVDHAQYGAHGKKTEMILCYSNVDGSFIGIPNDGTTRFIRGKGLSQVQKNPNTDGTVASVGFSEKEQKWYGWSHRAIYGFGVGAECKKGHCAYVPANKDDFIKDTCRWYKDIMEAKELEITEKSNGVHVKYASQGGLGIDELIPFPDEYGRGEWKCKNLRDARDMAADFAESVASIIDDDDEGLDVTGG